MDKELIEFLGQKFDRIENRIEQMQEEVNNRIDRVETRLNHRIDDLETRVNQGFAEVNQRIDTLTHTVEEINRRDLDDSNAFAADIANLDKRVTRLETAQPKAA